MIKTSWLEQAVKQADAADNDLYENAGIALENLLQATTETSSTPERLLDLSVTAFRETAVMLSRLGVSNPTEKLLGR